VRTLEDIESEVVLKRIEVRRRADSGVATAEIVSLSEAGKDVAAAEEMPLDPDQIAAAAWIPGRTRGLPF
jgi:hypothetical protein